MEVVVLENADAVARRAADVIATQARLAVAERGVFSVAISGGRTPWLMLRALGMLDIPWDRVHFFQVDERVAPSGNADRNLTHAQASLFEHSPLRPDHIHAMPVEADDLDAACRAYVDTIETIAGKPAVLDLVHLGLGADGHTASLVPGDASLEVSQADVAMTDVYQGRRRMTLTFPLLNRARMILWVVTGVEKVEMLGRLRSSDPSIPAGRIRRDGALIVADAAAANR